MRHCLCEALSTCGTVYMRHCLHAALSVSSCKLPLMPEYEESFISWNQRTEKYSRFKSETLLRFPAARQGHVASLRQRATECCCVIFVLCKKRATHCDVFSPISTSLKRHKFVLYSQCIFSFFFKYPNGRKESTLHSQPSFTLLSCVAQSVQRLATDWTVRGSNPGGGEIFRTCPDRPWGPNSLLYNGYRVFPRDKERLGRDADPSHLLVPWSRKSTAIPVLPLWTVRPVQSLSAYTRVHFSF